MNLFCSPSLKPSKTGCFDRNALIRIVNNYNERNKDKIVYSFNTSNEELWKRIDSKIEKHCNNGEICWLNDPAIKNDSYLLNYYKPISPEGQYTWLKTSNINLVLRQYEDKYKDFTFMGTVPIDFDIIIKEIALINVCKLNLNMGKRKIGFVFNLDNHKQKGSHWVCMYVDFNVKCIYYFDSVGNPPPREIIKLIEKISLQTKKCTGMNLTLKINTIKHQKGNTECGVYCLCFIYKLLNGETFEKINSKRISDEEVNKMRNFFFRPTF